LFCRRFKKNGGQDVQALGRSRGGFSTKIHIAVDALGNPLRFILTQGQVHDISQAISLLDGYKADAVIADKGYDSDEFLNHINLNAMESVIPPRSCRKQERIYDKERYVERHLVECFINKIKQFRRIFSRFDKLAKCYMAFLQFVASLIWLR